MKGKPESGIRPGGERY